MPLCLSRAPQTSALPLPPPLLCSPLASQVPVFAYFSMTLRRMADAGWPGFEGGGALWFGNLTLPAYVWSTGELPMGLAGLVLPAVVTGLTLASIRLGFAASGEAPRLLLLGALCLPH